MTATYDHADQYTALVRQSFVLGEQHARAIIIEQLAAYPPNAVGHAYGALLNAVDRLFPDEDAPPYDAGYAAGLAVGLCLAGGGARATNGEPSGEDEGA